MNKIISSILFLFIVINSYSNDLENKALNKISQLQEVINFTKLVEKNKNKVIFITNEITKNYVEISVLEDNKVNTSRFETYRYTIDNKLYKYDIIENKYILLKQPIKNQLNNQKSELIKYLNTIGRLNEETQLQAIIVKNGDLNNDGLTDIVFQYDTSIKNGKMRTGSGIITYLNKSDKYIFSNDYQFTDFLEIDTIINNVLYVKEFSLKNTDSFYNPSNSKTKKFILKNNQLINIK